MTCGYWAVNMLAMAGDVHGDGVMAFRKRIAPFENSSILGEVARPYP
jgi:hypothetical protein